jgi:hypothetical protein
MIIDLTRQPTLFDIMPGVLFVPVGGALAMIDSQDADLLRYRWSPSGDYVGGTVGGQRVLMHRLIMERALNRQLDGEIFVDHQNGNTRDNRRENLRLADRFQNAQNQRRHSNNTSGYRGVSKVGTRWQARIAAYGRRIHLGYHDTPEQAYSAYCEAARVHHGAFARLEIIDTTAPSPETVGRFEKAA